MTSPWDDQPLDVVVDESEHGVQVLVEQIEYAASGQMILNDALLQVPIDLLFRGHADPFMRVCSSPAEHRCVRITTHRGQRQIHHGGWQVCRDTRDVPIVTGCCSTAALSLR